MAVPGAFNLLAKLTRITTAGNQTSGSIAVTTGGILWVVVAATGSVTAENAPISVTCTHSGAAAFTQQIACTPGVTSKVSLYVYSTTGQSGSGTVTVQLTASAPADATIIIFETPNNWSAITGIVASPVISGTSATPSATLSATPTSNDRTLAILTSRNINAVPTPGTGFGQVDEFHGTSPVAAVYIEDMAGSVSATIAIAGGAGTVANDFSGLIIQGSAAVPVANQTDDAGLTDALTITFVRGAPQTDDTGLTDSATETFIRGQINTDSAGLTDSAVMNVNRFQNQTDDAGLTDSVITAIAKAVSQTDGSGLTDSLIIAFIRGQTNTDLVGLTDNSTAQVFPPPSASATDNAGLTDTFVVAIVHGGLVAGTIMDQIMADLITRGYLVGTVLDREYKRLVDATGVPNGGAGKTIDDLYALNNERNRVALESVAIIPKT